MPSVPSTDGRNPPVTYSALWIQEGQGLQIEPILQSILDAASKFEGHWGALLRPESHSELIYQAMVAFDSTDYFRAWEASQACRTLVGQAEAFAAEPASVQLVSGFQSWFASPGSKPPAKWKTILVTAAALYPVVGILMAVLSIPFLRGMNPSLSLAVTLLLACILITYFVTRLLKVWLSRERP